MKKGDKLDNLLIDTMASEGKTVAKQDGMVIFLQGGAPGDTVEAEITKIKSSYLEGRVTAIRSYSPHRAQPFCNHFGTCGGCSWQHINYETQLFYKQKQVTDNLERIGGLTLPPILPIIPSSKTSHYRNRLDFTFTAQRWLTKSELNEKLALQENNDLQNLSKANALEHNSEANALDHNTKTHSPLPRRGAGGEVPAAGGQGLGFHIPRMYDKVFDVIECHLQPEPSNAIRLAVKDLAVKEGIHFFDLRKQVGYLRSLTLRTANTGDVMVILQVAYDREDWLEKILTMLADRFPSITSLNYVINGKRNDTFSDLDIVCWKGNGYITESMPAFSEAKESKVLKFRVGPKSFYQTNSDQAYELYKAAARVAGLTGNELVYDLYTGTGTIANFVAGHAKKVIGLEYVPAAIEDAKVNSKINGITNTEFFAGDIKDLLSADFISQHGQPDVVITDPPRVGMHEDVTRMLLQAAPKRIVYVSCNPATQARDLKILAEKYTIESVQPVDMFPQTMHVENVVNLIIS